ncbi:MAG TPA: M50 family metallopeptidase [Opitutaceae bacterium]|nr:M50 family metallopeptidase [Opitutaceae bacterium]
MSFLLLLAWFGWLGWSSGRVAGMVVSVGLVIAFFTCVVLHELGHALTARRYGVQTSRILLMPIGGMAEMDRIPRQPRAELLITAAGPAVNLAIALLLLAVVDLPAGWPWEVEVEDSFAGIGQVLLVWNLMMFGFNLLPVFPMDGGRIYRALLASRHPYVEATRRAVRLGQILAMALAAAALLSGRPLLFVLFVFIYLAAGAEYRHVQLAAQEAAYYAQLARRAAAVDPHRPDEPPLILHGPN